MKKFAAILMTALFIGAGLSSCQESREKQDKTIIYKIENKDSLSSEDYGRMIQYVGEYAEKAQKYLDMQNADATSTEAAEGLATLKEEYPHVDIFRNCIRETPLSVFDESNLKEIGKYAGYIEFDVPNGYEIQTAGPDAAGFEVESQPGDSSGQVQSVEEEKVVQQGSW